MKSRPDPCPEDPEVPAPKLLKASNPKLQRTLDFQIPAPKIHCLPPSSTSRKASSRKARCRPWGEPRPGLETNADESHQPSGSE
eukprot:1709875-Pyramimonas_sp.AAC.1